MHSARTDPVDRHGMTHRRLPHQTSIASSTMHTVDDDIVGDLGSFDNGFPASNPRPKERFEATITSADATCPELEQTWNRMLADGRSPERLYQTPAFIQHLRETQVAENGWELVVVRRRSDAHVVGIIPVRNGKKEIHLRLGPLSLFKRNIQVVQVLGSVPLLQPDEEELFGFALKQLIDRKPDGQALLMQAIPMEMSGEFRGLKNLSHYLLRGWRDCHTAPLPLSVAEYLQKFSSKKRYNLSRQVRLLSKDAEEARLVRITEAAQIPALMEAVRALPSAQAQANRQNALESLARNGLLLCYVLQRGSEVLAVIVGSRCREVWHVHNIHCSEKYTGLSVGTSITHLAMQDVIGHLALKRADFGYGSPNQEYRATHVLEKRGTILVCRTRSLFNVLFAAYVAFDSLNETLIERVKKIRKQYLQRGNKPARDPGLPGVRT